MHAAYCTEVSYLEGTHNLRNGSPIGNPEIPTHHSLSPPFHSHPFHRSREVRQIREWKERERGQGSCFSDANCGRLLAGPLRAERPTNHFCSEELSERVRCVCEDYSEFLICIMWTSVPKRRYLSVSKETQR